MEKINAWATVNLALLTFIAVGTALATFLIQFTNLPKSKISLIIIIYILAILLINMKGWMLIK